MAKIFLNAGETFNVGANSVANVVGNSGAERVSIVSGEIIADQNVERIDLPNASSTYKFAVSGNQVKIYTGTTLVATYDAGGTNQVVAFSNGSAPLVYNGQNAVTLGGAAIPAVAATITPTVNASDTSSSATGGSTPTGVTGSTFTLTTGAELLNTTTSVATNKTTSGDDLIYGNTSNSFDNSDIIDAGAGTDKLTATIANVSLTPILTSVENLVITANVKSDASTSASNDVENTTLDLSTSTGVASVVFKAVDTVKATFNGTGDGGATATLTGLSSTSTAISLAGATGGLTTGYDETLDVNLVYDYAAVKGATDAVTVALNNTNKLDIAVKSNTGTVVTGDKEGVETIDLTSTVAASSIGIIGSFKQDGSTGVLKTLGISGDKDLTIGDVVNFATSSTASATVDASTFTGKLSGTFNVAGVNDAITVTSFSGDDTITVTVTGAVAAVVNVATGAGKDVIDVTDIVTRSDDATTTTVDESKIVNITINSGEGDDTIKIGTGNVSIDAGAGNDTLTLNASGATSDLDKYDTINMGDGIDTVQTSDKTINSSDKTDILSRISNAEVIQSTATGAKVIDISAITGFATAKVSGASGTIAAASAAATPVDGGAAVTFTSTNDTSSLIISAAQTGQAGGTDTGTGGGGAGGVALKLTPKLDNGSNSVSLTLIDNATLTGGAGGARNTAGNGGAGAMAIDATSYELVNIVLSATDTTADAVALVGGAAGSGGSGTTSNTGITVGTNAVINVTDALSGTATLVTHYSSINFNDIKGSNVTINAATLKGAVIIDSVEGNTSITTGSGDDVVVGGTGKDSISVGAGDDNVTGGADADTIIIGDGNDVVVFTGGTTDSAVAAYDSITGFTLASASWTSASNSTTTFQSGNAGGTNLNTDLLDLSVTTGAANALAVAGASSTTGTTATSNVEVSATGKVTFAAADDTLAKKLVAVAADTTDVGLGKAVFFEDSGNSYVFLNTTTDVVVELVGVTGAAGLGLLAASGTVGGANYIMIV